MLSNGLSRSKIEVGNTSAVGSNVLGFELVSVKFTSIVTSEASLCIVVRYGGVHG